MVASMLAAARHGDGSRRPAAVGQRDRLGRGEGPARHGLRDAGGGGAQTGAGGSPGGGQRDGRTAPGPDPRTEDRTKVRGLDAAAGTARLSLGREGVEAGAARLRRQPASRRGTA